MFYLSFLCGSKKSFFCLHAHKTKRRERRDEKSLFSLVFAKSNIEKKKLMNDRSNNVTEKPFQKITGRGFCLIASETILDFELLRGGASTSAREIENGRKGDFVFDFGEREREEIRGNLNKNLLSL